MTDPTEMTTALEVIDATLAGDPVGPEHAELAELSLLLAGEREPPSPGFSARLDARVTRRFAEPLPADNVPRAPWWRRHWLLAPGAAVALAGVIAVVVVLSGGGPTGPRVIQDAKLSHAAAQGATTVSSTSSAAPARAPRSAAPAPAGALSPGSGSAGVPTPSTQGRQVVQSAGLSLFARPARVDGVAQEVFGVVSAQHGIVKNSNIDVSGTYGNANFLLSFPSWRLSQALTALSELPGARVLSRTDSSQDITAQVGSAGRRLAEDRALRRSYLRQLAAATTEAEVTKLKAQLASTGAAIARDVAAVNGLHRQVADSDVTVTISSSTQPTPVDSFYTHPAGGGGFTLDRAVHDAGRVLVVTAGVALIALAVLVPVALLIALGAWLAAALRRRRREQVLDLI